MAKRKMQIQSKYMSQQSSRNSSLLDLIETVQKLFKNCIYLVWDSVGIALSSSSLYHRTMCCKTVCTNKIYRLLELLC